MYEGYQIKVGELKLPIPDGELKSIFVPDSYNFNREKRLIAEWQDANGKFHHETYPEEKTTISFTIKERSMEQQALLRPLLSQRNNIEAEYWDDINEGYKKGLFFIDKIDSISSIATEDKIYYGELDVTLTEY